MVNSTLINIFRYYVISLFRYFDISRLRYYDISRFRGFDALKRYLNLCLDAVVVVAQQFTAEAVSVLQL